METPQKQKLRQEAESLKQRLQSDLMKFQANGSAEGNPCFSSFAQSTKEDTTRPVRKYKVKEESLEVAQVLQHNTGPYILKVKRKRDDDALDEIYLEYDLQGSFKRTKLVTEAETLQSRLSQFRLKDPSPQVSFKPNTEFSLGKGKEDNKQQKTQQVRLKRLRLPQSQSQHDEAQIRQFCTNILSLKRNELRKQVIEQKRQGPGEKSEETKASGSKEAATKHLVDDPDLEIMQVIGDLKELLKQHNKEIGKEDIEEEEKGDYVYEYFLCDNDGDLVCNPARPVFESDRRANNDSDYDSQDSNREDHEKNEYPEENYSQSDDDFEENIYRNQSNKAGKMQDIDEIDEETASNRYMKKQRTHNLFDKLLRKNKGWAHQNKMPYQVGTGQLHEYEPDISFEEQSQTDDEESL